MMSDYGVGALGGVVLIDPETGLPYKASGGGGGGGAVDSVNGQTGEVELDLNDVVSEGGMAEGPVMVVDDLDSPTQAASLTYGQLLIQTPLGAATYADRFVSLADPEGGTGNLLPPVTPGGPYLINLPSSDGTLALTSDISTPPAPETGTYILSSEDGVSTWITIAELMDLING